MKICFLSSMHRSNDKRVHEKEARSLVDAGFSVIHVCPGPQADRKVIDGVIVQQYISGMGLRGRILQLRRLYKLGAQEEADAYHCNEVDSWAVGVALKLFKGRTCIFDVHEHYPSAFSESRFPKWAQPFVAASVRFAFRTLLPLTDKIVLAKRTVSSDFRCSPEKKVLVRNFARKSSISATLQRSARRPGDEMTIVHIGLFSKVRGWPQVLEALAMTDDRVRLDVIGTINDGSQDEFFARLDALQLSSRVNVYDWMTFDKAFNHLLRSDVGIISFQPDIQNHVFAMPHKLFDYMAAGLSVLLPKQAIEVAPIVKDAECGLLMDPSDPKDIAASINFLFENPAEAEAMGENARRAISEEYNWEAEGKKLVQMYADLCS